MDSAFQEKDEEEEESRICRGSTLDGSTGQAATSPEFHRLTQAALQSMSLALQLQVECLEHICQLPVGEQTQSGA